MTRWKRSIYYLLTLGLVAVTTTGCWDRVEINDLALVVARGIDMTEDGKLMSTIEIVNPSAMSQGMTGTGGQSNAKPFLIVSGSGKDIGDISGKMQEKLSRRIFTAHRRILIIGEKLAKHGIENVIDHFTREPANRLRSYVLVARGTTAKEVLEQTYPLERITSEGIREMQMSELSVSTTIKDLVTMLSEEGGDPICAVIELNKNIDKNKVPFHLNGSAVFRNGKLVQYLDDTLTRGILWARDEMRQGIITFTIPKQTGYITVRLIHSATKVTPEVHGNHATMHIRIKTEGYVMENNTKLDLSNPEYVDICNTYMSKAIATRIQKAIDATKKTDTDPVSFGEYIHRSQLSQWQRIKGQWRKIIPTMQLDVKVNTQIRRVGMDGPGLEWKQDEVKK
ncbi:Ger(x)C family spore germination protein [Fodinisporobacter ferrooxydans]|uniref:Ger(X)C family spore germination protein n=1 Tax=Fodinisporobacter ferrooxydans TaxID=2901836 RepID=A0ABY4CG19_9BACL|nr:Ger(x)C family spore germination protein [Alicyclobacillaceae bacterium MYW30-H2]